MSIEELHVGLQTVTLVLMSDDRDDLRARFRRNYDRPVAPVRRPAGYARPVTPVPIPPPAPVTVPQAPTAPQAAERPSEPRSQSIPIVDLNQRHKAPAAPTEAQAEPVETHAEPVPAPPQAPSHHHAQEAAPKHHKAKRERNPNRHSAKQRLALASLTLVIAAGAAAGGWLAGNQRDAVIAEYFPQQYTSEKLGFTLFYPKNMPSGYRIAPGSYSTKDGALVFNINAADGTNIPVTEQALPAGNTADDLVPAPAEIKVTDAEGINFPGGKSSISKWDGKTLTSTVAGNTWIILNTTNLPKADAIALTQAFQQL